MVICRGNSQGSCTLLFRDSIWNRASWSKGGLWNRTLIGLAVRVCLEPDAVADQQGGLRFDRQWWSRQVFWMKPLFSAPLSSLNMSARKAPITSSFFHCSDLWKKWFSKGGPIPAASVSHGSWREMQILKASQTHRIKLFYQHAVGNSDACWSLGSIAIKCFPDGETLWFESVVPKLATVYSKPTKRLWFDPASPGPEQCKQRVYIQNLDIAAPIQPTPISHQMAIPGATLIKCLSLTTLPKPKSLSPSLPLST